MKILSWNVNGIRACIRNGFVDFLKNEKPDIIALQETKISLSKREEAKFDFSDYQEFWHSSERPGYSGTAIFVKNGIEVLHNVNGLGKFEFDAEGRVQTLELENFYFVNCYFPNSNHELSRLMYKLEFNDELLKYIKKLEKKKPVVVCGDFNVAREEIDLANPKENVGNAGFTEEERNWARNLIKAGFIDTFRYFYPEEIKYSWWTYRFGARRRNIGWRIDYFFVSKSFIKEIKTAFILDQVKGSDHAPVGIELVNNI